MEKEENKDTKPHFLFSYTFSFKQTDP